MALFLSTVIHLDIRLFQLIFGWWGLWSAEQLLG